MKQKTQVCREAKRIDVEKRTNCVKQKVELCKEKECVKQRIELCRSEHKKRSSTID